MVTLYPTSPFRPVSLVEHLVEMGLTHSCPVATVKAVPMNEYSAFTLGDNLTAHPLRVHDSAGGPGTIGCKGYGTFTGRPRSAQGGTMPYIHMLSDPALLIDIDTPKDLLLAEKILDFGLYTEPRPKLMNDTPRSMVI
ncbi:MAG: hypothetical protein D6E12_03335 [Desulfovibrio sp.]|nr:MAG: hypothetical protein D6E12_03335 [Desulfovibrio sp.]